MTLKQYWAVSKLNYQRGLMNGDQITQISVEGVWCHLEKPYYTIYPGVVKGFCNLKLDFKLTDFKLPHEAMVIRLAEGHELDPIEKDGKLYGVKSFLVGKLS